MLTPDTIAGIAPFARGRSPRVLLAVDPARKSWRATSACPRQTRAEVRQCRGDDNGRRFALQLCVVRKHSRCDQRTVNREVFRG